MKITFQSQVDSLGDMLVWLREALHALGVQEAYLNSLELACEEALVNILHHSYPEGSGPITLSCKRLTPTSIKIILLDRGPPHNPLHSIQLPSSPPRIGGYGIFMMLNLVDHVHYRRIHACNELTLIKESV